MKAPLRWMLVAALACMAGCMSAPDSKQDLQAAARANADAGTIYLRRGQYREAKEKLDAALKQDPDSFEANWAMGSLLEQIDRGAEAGRYYKTAIRQQPDNPDVANTYAAYLCKTGKVDDALPLFDSLIRNKLYRTPEAAATNAAVCLRSDKRNADALGYLERALTLRTDYVDAVILKADVQIALGRATQSRQTVDAYLALNKPKEADPHRPELLVVGVRAAVAAGDDMAARNYARLLRRDFPSSPQTAALPQLMPDKN